MLSLRTLLAAPLLSFAAQPAPASVLAVRTDDDADVLTPRRGDCDDADVAIHSGAPEVCDGVNSDCDDQVDGVGVCAGALPMVAPTGPLLLACFVATTGLLALTLRGRSFSRPRS